MTVADLHHYRVVASSAMTEREVHASKQEPITVEEIFFIELIPLIDKRQSE
ncbi:MAG: hypothetical protein IPQ22_14565 [Rhodoferax sp.]|nr:hypothetical protein [Rhodoferax sp.]